MCEKDRVSESKQVFKMFHSITMRCKFFLALIKLGPYVYGGAMRDDNDESWGRGGD